MSADADPLIDARRILAAGDLCESGNGKRHCTGRKAVKSPQILAWPSLPMVWSAFHYQMSKDLHEAGRGLA